jgi:hypothetical protein
MASRYVPCRVCGEPLEVWITADVQEYRRTGETRFKAEVIDSCDCSKESNEYAKADALRQWQENGPTDQEARVGDYGNS